MAAKEPTYSDAQIEAQLKDIPGWWYEDGWIRRTYKTDGWPTTLMLVNAIGYIAEAAYHHPDLSVTWGRVIVKPQNHAAGGITAKDFDLPRKIEETVLWRPTAGAKVRECLGAAGAGPAGGGWSIESVGGGNNAPRLARPAIRREAEHYHASGADLIDIGCTPGRVFAELADVVRELVDLGMRVSIDSFDPEEIRIPRSTSSRTTSAS